MEQNRISEPRQPIAVDTQPSRPKKHREALSVTNQQMARRIPDPAVPLTPEFPVATPSQVLEIARNTRNELEDYNQVSKKEAKELSAIYHPEYSVFYKHACMHDSPLLRSGDKIVFFPVVTTKGIEPGMIVLARASYGRLIARLVEGTVKTPFIRVSQIDGKKSLHTCLPVTGCEIYAVALMINYKSDKGSHISTLGPRDLRDGPLRVFDHQPGRNPRFGHWVGTRSETNPEGLKA